MTQSNLGRRLRRAMIVSLAAVVGYGAWQLTQPKVDPFEADGAGALEERFEDYVALRLQDDWPQIWEMVDPTEREKLDLGSFLGIYGKGVMKTHDIVKHDVDINYNTRVALVSVTTEAELIPSKLPSQFRAGLRIDDPSELQQSMQHDIKWIWRDGEWYFSLDEEIVSGATAEGRSVSPIETQG